MLRTLPQRAVKKLVRRLRESAGNVSIGLGRYGPIDTDGEDLDPLVQATARSLEQILQENILAFWTPRVIDERGGYTLGYDHNGKSTALAPRHLVGQARTLWFFSHLASTHWGCDDHLRLAQHGYEFLRDRQRDADHGGFHLEVDHNATPTSTGKHAYAISFALYALSEYARVSGDPQAVDAANTLFALFDANAHDDEFGGYHQHLRDDWTPAEIPTKSMPGAPGLKTIDTHLHIVEALTNYYRLQPQAIVRDRILELLPLITTETRDEKTGLGIDCFARDWTPINERRYQNDSYGHWLERIWLAADARDALGLSNKSMFAFYEDAFESCLKFGFDRRHGGFYESGRCGHPADVRRKTWWVQAEALACSLLLHKMTRSSRAAAVYLQTLAWIVEHQIDKQLGEWHMYVDSRQQPKGPKGIPAWKTPYHNGRAVLICLERLVPESRRPAD